MAGRNKSSGVGPRSSDAPAGSPGVRAAQRPLAPADERLNEEINGLLRDAAEQRERRTLAALAEDTASARRQFEAVVALARARTERSRG
jgi:hypothetical protein